MNNISDDYMKNTYYKSNGKFQKEYEKLYKELVPSMGPMNTIHGELLRAISKIYLEYHRFANFANTSGPVIFIMKNVKFDETNQKHIDKIYSWSNVFGHIPDDVSLAVELESVADYIIEWIMTGDNSKNEIDMWSYKIPWCNV